MEPRELSLIFVMGVSGAGRSTVLRALEDAGFYIIDNLPLSLIGHTLNLWRGGSLIDAARYGSKLVSRLAISLSIKSSADEILLWEQRGKVIDQGIANWLIFLDCKLDSILRRYSETRRPHPDSLIDQEHSLEQLIIKEKSRLSLIKEKADIIIDTSNKNIHETKAEVQYFLQSVSSFVNLDPQFRCNIISFGFKFGIPNDCDMVADVRFLANPHFIEALRPHTGLESPVYDFVLGQAEAKSFVELYQSLLAFVIGKFQESGRNSFTVGIGCTGGQHRSVAIAVALMKRLKEQNLENVEFRLMHRQISL